MSGIGIGTSDRGTFDREDALYIKQNALKTTKSAKEAEDFAKSNLGAEAIIKNENGDYTVYQLETDEAGKTITNEDFTKDNINLTKDVAKQFQGATKAYVTTTDNVIRSLEIKGIEFPSLDHKFARINLNVTLKDKDGIETKSKNDLEGTVSGDINITKELINHSLAQANKMFDADLKLTVENGQYKISGSKYFASGAFTLTPSKGGMDVKFNFSGVAGAAAWAASPVVDLDAKLMDFVKNKLASDMGLKAEKTSSNEMKLTPDFKNSNFLSQIPVGDMNLNLEEIKSNPENTSFTIDKRGDLKISLNNTKIIGSSDAKAAPMTKPDAEGSDKISSSISGTLNNDLSAEFSSNTSVSLNVTEEEKVPLAQRMKKLSGMGVELSGTVNISEVKVDAKVSPTGKVDVVRNANAKINGKDINVGLGDTQLKVDSTSGDLSVKEEGKKVILTAKDVNLKASIQSPTSNIEFKELAMNGSIVYDNDNPNKLKLKSEGEKGIQLSMSMTDANKNQLVSVDNLALKGTDVEIDTVKRTIALEQNGTSPVVVPRLKIGENVDLKNISFKGKLDVDAFSGKIVLDSKNLSFNGTLGSIKIDNLKGAGKLTYEPEKGIRIDNLNVTQASGKVGDFDISSLKAKGTILFDKDYNLQLTEASSVELDSKSGFRVKGDVSIAHSAGVYDITSKGTKPLNITYKPDGKKDSPLVSNLVIQGKITADTNTNTYSFNNGAEPFKIKQGSISGINFKNVALNGELKVDGDNLTLKNSKGLTSVSGSIAGINLKEFKSDGEIKIDTQNKSISSTGTISVNLPEQKLNLSTTGNMTISQNKEGNYVFDSKDGTITGKIGNFDLKDLKVQGNIIFNPKTNEVNFGNPEGQELKVSGFVQGKKVDLTSSGKVGFNQKDGELKISTNGVKLNGSIEGFNLRSNEGTKGEVTLSAKGDIVGVSGFETDIEIDGISLKATGGLNSTDSGYALNLSGSVKPDAGKINQFLDKLATSSFVPDTSKQSIKDLQEKLKKLDLQNLKYDDLNVKFGKDFSFQEVKGTVSQLNWNVPEKGWSVESKGPINFEMDKDYKVSLMSKGQTINGKAGDTEFKNFSVTGKMSYDPTSGNVKFSGVDNENLRIKGMAGNKKIDLSANADVNLKTKGNDLEFTSNNVDLNGELDGFKFKSLSNASGKFLIKNDGHIDLSQLKFNFQIDDIKVSNKDGGIKGSDDGYEVKLSGDLDMSQKSLISFLDKVAHNSTTPEQGKKVISETIQNIKNYMIVGDFKQSKFSDLSLKIDKEFQLKSFDAKTDFVMDNTSIKLGLGANKDNKMNLGTVNFSTKVEVTPDDFRLKNAKLSFKLTPDVKESMGNEVKNMLSSYGLKDMDVSISDDGKIKLNKATFGGLPIINVDVGGEVKFEGTKMNVVVDKAQVKGFFGKIAQGLAEGVFGVDSKAIGIQETLKRANDLKMNYQGGDHKFSIDFQEILHDNISEDLNLKKAEVKNGVFTLDYDVMVGQQKSYNPTTVANTLKTAKSLINSGKGQEQLKTTLTALNGQDLSKTFDKLTLLNVKAGLKDDDKVIAVMKKLTENQNVGKNSLHLTEFASYANDDIALGFINSLSDEQIRAMDNNTKAFLINKLFDGNTNGDEEQGAKRLMTASRPADTRKLIDMVGLEKIKDELDRKDVTDILKVANAK